jgi:erythrocyte band 7 integral membrane protein
MQIRYLEAMQAMAKSSNSKIIFMPGPPNSNSLTLPTVSEAGPSTQDDDQFSQAVSAAVNARVLESM